MLKIPRKTGGCLASSETKVRAYKLGVKVKMKKFLLAAAALALGVHGALASDGWFKVTEPILICEVSQDMACDHVKVGTVFYFDRADQGDIAGLTHLWRMPDITEVFVMPGDWRSAFKPTHAPKGW
jgi:hypothetical protein